MKSNENTVKNVKQTLEEQDYYFNDYESHWDDCEKNDLLDIFGIERDDLDPMYYFRVSDFIDSRF